ncbi:hypothetical protein HK097_005671, partial [Rhizophlyctis rosea]
MFNRIRANSGTEGVAPPLKQTAGAINSHPIPHPTPQSQAKGIHQYTLAARDYQFLDYPTSLNPKMPPRSNLIYGSGNLWSAPFSEGQQFLDILPKLGITQIDTARVYGEAEATLGKLTAAERFNKFVIDTKVPGFGTADVQRREKVFEAQRESFEKLGVEK